MNSWKTAVFNRQFIIAPLTIIVVVSAGIYMYQNSQAATVAIQIEPENGLPANPALIQPDNTASGASSIKFSPGMIGKSAGSANTYWLHFNGVNPTNEQLTLEAKRRKVILLNSWEYKYIPILKAANPKVIVLVYKDASSTREYACRNGIDDALLPSGVGYCYANTHHPEWFLKDSAGNRLLYNAYAGHYQMDIGNISYQQEWLKNVKAELIDNKWDGTFIDNALFACDQYHAGICPASYGTNAAFQDAYVSFFKSSYASLKPANLKSVANMANARLYPGLWNRYITYLDGGFDEFWLVFSPGSYLPEYGTPSYGWKAQTDEIAYAASLGKMAFVLTHTDFTDTKGFYYGYASYLMVNDGNAMFGDTAGYDAYGAPSPWVAAYDWDLGTPNGFYKILATNIYRRDFKCGLVIVNSNQTGTAYTVTFAGTMLNETNTSVSSVAVGPTTGTILRTPNCTP